MLARFKITVAASIVRSGGVIAYPTETVFGLGCDPNNGHALTKILTLKQRSPGLGMILIADRWSRLLPYIQVPNQRIWKKLQQNVPRPTTWLVPFSHVHPLITGSHNKIAVRISNHPLCQQLCAKLDNAIVSTSANISGRRPAVNVLQVHRQFGQRLDGVLYGSSYNQPPSDIVDAIDDRVIRAA